MIHVEDLVKRLSQGPATRSTGSHSRLALASSLRCSGPMAAGKTTTISILTTTLAPTSGRVTIDSYDIVSEASAVRREVGIIFQSPSLDVNLTGEENIRFHAVLYGLFPYAPAWILMDAAYRRQVDELSGLLGVQRDIFQPVRT